MKKYISLTTSASILLASGFLFLSTTESKKAIKNDPEVLSMTASISIPDKVQFANESVDLSRYDMHERYDREINGFTYLHSTTLLLIKRANRIFPIIEPILKANGIPEDFKYLAAIESSLDPRAISSAKAAGLWQFMPSTGKQYGLEISSEVDERYHIEKATIAACQYLKDAYNRYGNWASVAISYNAGMGRVSGELDKQQVEEGVDLWLVPESYRYYFRMLALKSIFDNPYKYGFVLSPQDLYKPIDFNKVTVYESIPDLAQFATENGTTYAQLKDFNSWLRDRKLTISNKSASFYTLLIPKQESLFYRKGERAKVHDKNWITKD